MSKPLPKQAGKKKAAGKNKSRPSFRLMLWTGLIMIIAFIAFVPGLRNELVNWDDFNYIRDNPVIRSLSAENLAYIFNLKTFIMGNYHPFTILSYAIEYSLAGNNSFIYHFTNILLHLFNIALFAWMVWLLTGKQYATLIAAALFAIHPMRVESVVWAAERKDVLYTLFYLLALICYIFYIQRTTGKLKYYVLSLVFFLFSIFSKGQAVVLPLTFILADYWFRRKINLRSLSEKIPFFILSIFFGIVAIMAQSSSLTSERMISHTFFERLMFAGYNITAYLYKLIFPYWLACFYGYPKSDELYLIYIGAVIAVVILLIVFIRLRKNRTVMFGSLFFLSTIFIVIQLMPIGNAIIADRYTYIPYMGLFFMAGVLLDPLIGNPGGKRTLIRYLLLIQLIIFGIVSFIQSGIWRNNETLWSHVLKIDPREAVAYNNLGIAYLDKLDYEKAIDCFNNAIKYRENYPEIYRAYHNLGKAFSETNRKEEGIRYYSMAISMVPVFSDAYFGRGLTYTEIAKYDSAIKDFTTILNQLKPGDPQSYYSRAMAYNKKNMPDSAIADYTRAINTKPDYSDALTNRGNIYFNHGDPDRAIMDYNQSLKFVPGSGSTLLNRSFAYFLKKEYGNALEDAERAAALKTNVSPAYINDLKSKLNH